MALTTRIEAFADSTSMHGVPKIIRSRSLYGRVFWSCICTFAAFMFVLQLTQLLHKYFMYPKKVTLEVVPSSVPFPAISLCNMRNLDIMVLNKLNRIFKTVEDPREWQNIADDEFTREYMRVVSKYHLMYQNESLDVLQTVLTRSLLATNIDPLLLHRASVPFKEFIITCRFGSHSCNITRDFRHFFDYYYYNCFTYNAPQPDDPDSTLAEGLENGWSTTILAGSGMLDKNVEMRAIPGTHDALNPMSGSAGARVVIHPRNTKPYPNTEGFDVPPGYSVSFGVKARENVRVKPPHGNCLDANPFKNRSNTRYRLIACQKQCLQQTITRTCQCKDNSLPGHEHFPHLKFCSNDSDVPIKCKDEISTDCRDALYRIYERIICVRNASQLLIRDTKLKRDCGCFQPCYELSYDVTYSLAKWPAQSFDGEESWYDIFNNEKYGNRFNNSDDIQKFNLFLEYFNDSNRHEARKDFARLNVYIADGNVLKTEESADYTGLQLLSDIGGQLGLWVGISVITLAEMLELFTDMFTHLFKRYASNNKDEKFSRYSWQRIGARRRKKETKRVQCDNNVMIDAHQNDCLEQSFV